MTREYLIFVPPIEINDADMAYHEVISWGYNNLEHPNVFVLNHDELFYLQSKSDVLKIINNVIDGMLEISEDDAVYSQDQKVLIKEKLSDYLMNVQDAKLKPIIETIIKLLEIAIRTNRAIFFHF